MSDGTNPQPGLSPLKAVDTVTKPFRVRIALFAACTFGVGLLEALFLVVVTRAALAIANGSDIVGVTRNVELTITETALVGLVVLAIRFAIYYVTARVQSGLTYRITAGYRKQLGASYLGASWQSQSQQPAGFLQQVVVQFPNQIANLVTSIAISISGGLALVALLGIALVIDTASTLLVFAALIILALVLVPIARSIRRKSARSLHHQVEFANSVSEISNLSLEINTFGVGDTVQMGLEKLVDDEAASTRRVGLTGGLVSPIYMTLAYGAVLLALLALDSVGAEDINEVGAVMLIMMRSLGYGQQLQNGLTAIGQYTPYAERILATSTSLNADKRQNGARLSTNIASINFSNVDFTYPGRDQGLSAVTFALGFGETIGIMGPSGSGKTTLVQLLLGLLPPSSGTILVDGVPLTEHDRVGWNRLACYVPQEPKLVTGTIADNVRFFRDGISDDDIRQALAAANFVLDPERFPEGIDSSLGSSGRQLSGGQKQRLVIARALATSPSLLILDEPTSALDAESEEIIAETLRRLKGEVLTIVVSHRSSTLEICDRRLVVDGGSVREMF
jgi:ABC-type multidrug transport system fused ATPase/permease subunit